MSNLTLINIEEIVTQLALKIDVPTSLLPTYGRSDDGARPHIEASTDGFLHYVIVERGQELERKTTANADDLLYWVFAGVTFSMACTHELKHREAGQDSRKLMFEKQEELLGVLDEHWKWREHREHQRIIEKHPFVPNC